MSPAPELPWPPQPAEAPATPPVDVPMPSPTEIPVPAPTPMPMPSPQPPITARRGSPARRWVARLAAGVAIVAGLAANATAADAVGAADRRFMDEATSAGMVGIVLGRLAVEKGTTEPVKRVGQQMVDDHVKANESLKAMAAAKGVQLPTGLSTEERATASRMKKMKGTAFDSTYLSKTASDGQRAVAVFSQAANGAVDNDVKAFAQAQLPTLRSHLDTVRQAIAVKVVAPKRGTAARE